MRNSIVALLLSSSLSAQAALLLTTFDTDDGRGFQETTARLQAFSEGDSDEQVRSDFTAPLPYNDSLSAMVAAASISEQYAYGHESLRITTSHERYGYSRALTVTDGKLVFSVSESTHLRVRSAYSVQAEVRQTLTVMMYLDDLTSNSRLFAGGYDVLSSDWSQAVGALPDDWVWWAQPGHVYRLLYVAGLGRFETNASRAVADGFIAVSAVPTPSTAALLFATLWPLALVRARFRPAAVRASQAVSRDPR